VRRRPVRQALLESSAAAHMSATASGSRQQQRSGPLGGQTPGTQTKAPACCRLPPALLSAHESNPDKLTGMGGGAKGAGVGGAHKQAAADEVAQGGGHKVAPHKGACAKQAGGWGRFGGIFALTIYAQCVQHALLTYQLPARPGLAAASAPKPTPFCRAHPQRCRCPGTC
jgi:hypothetical protein